MDERMWQASGLGPTTPGVARGGPTATSRRIAARRILGARLAAWRTSAQVSRYHAADLLAVPAWKVTTLEAGEAPWTQQMVTKLAQLVGVAAERLVAEAMASATAGIDQTQVVAWAAAVDEQTWQATIAAVDRLRRQPPPSR